MIQCIGTAMSILWFILFFLLGVYGDLYFRKLHTLIASSDGGTFSKICMLLSIIVIALIKQFVA